MMYQFAFLILCFANYFATGFVLPIEPMFTGLQYGSYYKGPVCEPSEPMRHPKTPAEVVAIVHEAISKNQTVKALGAQHSATDIICTSGIPISMKGIVGMTMNNDVIYHSVSVGAGVTLYTLNRFLKDNERALRTFPAYSNLTIGGAIATGAHGSSIKYTAALSEQVISMEIVDGLGNIQTITDPTELLAFKVHLGLLGIVLSVTLKTVPLYKVIGNNYETSDDILFNGKIVDIARETDQLEVDWFPSLNKVVICNWTFLDDVNTPGNAMTNIIGPSYDAYNLLVSNALELVQATDSSATMHLLESSGVDNLIQTVPLFFPYYTEDGITMKNPAVGYAGDMLTNGCDASGPRECGWLHGPNNITTMDNEMSIALSDVGQFVRRVKDILKKYPASFIIGGIAMRFSANNDIFMSTSHGQNERAHVEFLMFTRKNRYSTASSGPAAYQAIQQTLAFEFNGRSHWGKSGFYYHTKELINSKVDPKAKSSFIERMNKYDPNGVFINDFARRLKGTGNKMNMDPKTKHCALLDNCICKKNTDCAFGQFCSRIEGYPNYPVCKLPGHSLDIFNPIPHSRHSRPDILQGIISGSI